MRTERRYSEVRRVSLPRFMVPEETGNRSTASMMASMVASARLGDSSLNVPSLWIRCAMKLAGLIARLGS